MQCWGQRPGRQRVTIEGSAMQCKQLKVFSQRSGRWMVARYCRKAWNPIAWWPKKAKVIERSADLYSCFTAYKERLLAKDGWTVCRNLTDQTLLLSVKDEFLGWVAESDVWIIYPKDVHPWHLWPLCWNHLNNVPFPWEKKCGQEEIWHCHDFPKTLQCCQLHIIHNSIEMMLIVIWYFEQFTHLAFASSSSVQLKTKSGFSATESDKDNYEWGT